MNATAAPVVSSIAPATTWPLWLLRPFALDVRALVALRIGMALVLLWDLAFRARDLTAHYTDAGVLPRAGRIAMQFEFCEPWWMSLHMLSGAVWWQATLFLVAAAAALLLLSGYRTRLALLVSWFLLLSLHGRFPLLTQGGDMLLRCMLFWSLFLPWKGNERSQESGSRNQEGSINNVVSMGTVAFVVQLALVYVFTAMLKTAPSWRGEFSATYYALSIDHFTAPLGYVLLDYPRLLQVLTAGSLLLEGIGPWLLLMPLGQRWIRIVVPLAFIGFHLGLVATMHLGTFPWICILFWIVLLPPAVWDRIQMLLAKVRLIPDQFRRVIYGRDERVALVGSAASGAIVAFLLTYVVLLNVNRLVHPLATVGGPPLSLVGKVTGLDQHWNMFSPGPYKFGGWLRLEGETADGRLVNLYAPGEPLPDTKPECVSSTYSTQYWRRCLVTMYEFQERPHQEGCLRYFVAKWNTTKPAADQVVRGRLIHMVEPTPDPFAAKSRRSVERRELCSWEERSP